MGTTVGYRIKFACNAKNSDGALAGFYGNCLPFRNLIKLANDVFCHLPVSAGNRVSHARGPAYFQISTFVTNFNDRRFYP
jgi:hypothetical protein